MDTILFYRHIQTLDSRVKLEYLLAAIPKVFHKIIVSRLLE